MKKRPTSGIWPLSNWRSLLAHARRLLDDSKFEAWAFGGGTAVASRLDHRISYDIDIFVRDPQILGYLSPRLNEMAMALSESYEESASGIKIVTKIGDIDFVAVRDLTPDPSVVETIDGLATVTHTNAEILAKKIEFRGFKFTHRDMFDLAVLIDLEPSSVDKAIKACSRANLESAFDIVRKSAGRLTDELPDYVNPTRSGAVYVRKAPTILLDFVRTYSRAMPASVPPRAG